MPAHLLAPIGLPLHVQSKKVTSLESAADTVLHDLFKEHETRTARFEGFVVSKLWHVVDTAIGKPVMKSNRLTIQLEEKE